MFAAIKLTLSAAVAQNGTFTVGYPADTGSGSFANSVRHKMYALGAEYLCPRDFTVSFASSNATVTYKGATTLPAGTPVRIQFDMSGADTTADVFDMVDNDRIKRASTMLIDFGVPLAAVTGAFVSAATGTELPNAATKTYTKASIGTSPCDGVNTNWVMDVPRNVQIVQTKATSVAGSVTVTGKDEFGAALKETISWVGSVSTSETIQGKKAFASISQFDITSASDLTGATVDIGFGDILGLPCFVGSAAYVLEEYESEAPLGRWPEKVVIPWEIEETQLLASTTEELISPVAGRIVRNRTTVQKAITTGGTIAAKVNTVAVTGLSATIANSATKGTVATSTPTAGTATAVVAAGDRIEIVPASFATAGEVNGLLEIEPTAAGRMAATLVAGSTSTPSATTGDVRGTYDPVSNLDGSVAVKILLAGVDPLNLGGPQYAG